MKKKNTHYFDNSPNTSCGTCSQCKNAKIRLILKEARTGDLAFDWSQKSRCSNYDVLRVMGYKGAMDALYCGNEKLSLKVGPNKSLVTKYSRS